MVLTTKESTPTEAMPGTKTTQMTTEDVSVTSRDKPITKAPTPEMSSAAPQTRMTVGPDGSTTGATQAEETTMAPNTTTAVPRKLLHVLFFLVERRHCEMVHGDAFFVLLQVS